MKTTPGGLLRTRWRQIAIAGIILAVAIAVVWYLLENPYNQAFGPTVTHVPMKAKYVALTFDDGPNPPYTDEIVDYLHQQHVTATFFLVGMAVEKYPDSVRRELQYGDAIGNHSWDHAHMVLESRRHIQRELDSTDQAIFDATGEHTRLFRPPFGARDYAVIQVARSLGYQVIMWSVPLARDWESPPPQVIADRITRHISDGAIFVLHDGNKGRAGDRSATVEATKLIVTQLRAQGYQFVTVSQLIALGVSAERTPPPGSDDMGGEP
ncbi:MAG: polysaccharide deacetylase family protein [Candidatus Eremiobacteraeota bacterium]|nr:polysaccharide deacetylase family protein [Candidatus Eremiobacteraeota bacterium]MBV8282058.1 polysaccharide deacetylase family protein [Candidatus Eremiobacteraeota bacterium]